MYAVKIFFLVLALAGTNSESDLNISKEAEKPEVKFLHIQSAIKFRYATTNVTCGIKNNADISKEVFFSVTLPENAFISKFLMEIDGVIYNAYLKGKEEAKEEYKNAVSSGNTAAHIESKATRYSNIFKISVNVEKMGDVKFVLIYEEFLTRNFGYYEHLINLNPQQVVKDLTVDVFISESSNIKNLFIPQLRTGNEIVTDEKESSIAKKEIHGKYAHIQYKPTIEEQENELKESNYRGQLAVQYDVERNYSDGGQILINDGYFVHFFSPEDLKPLRKFVVFILDTSGSMHGRRIEQLKTSMDKILSDLKTNDYFQIMDFSYSVKVHNLDNHTLSAVIRPDSDINPNMFGHFQLDPATVELQSNPLPKPYLATAKNIEKGKEAVKKTVADGGTNIYDALKNAIMLAKTGIDQIRAMEKNDDIIQPLIIFLTDGEPSVGITEHDKIISMVKTSVANEMPIYSLGFGSGADIEFLRKVSLAGNNAIARSIYEASDAALQLDKFYETISSPVMSNITFRYLQDNSANKKELSKTKFLYLNKGSEIMVTGLVDDDFNPQVTGYTVDGLQTLNAMVIRDIPDDDFVIYIDKIQNKTKPKPPQKYSLERSWAYLTIKQLIDKYDNSEAELEKEKFKNDTFNLAKKYEFVTPFTSLVVVKPNATDVVTSDSLKTGLDDGEQHFNRLGASMPKAGFYYTANFLSLPAPRPNAGAPVPPAAGFSSPGFPITQAEISTFHMTAMPVSSDDDIDRADMGDDPSWLTPPDFIAANQTLMITIDGETKYYIVKNKSEATMTSRTTDEEKCTIKANDNGTTTQGVCMHLRNSDCTASTITEYKNLLFCVIENQYAGICC